MAPQPAITPDGDPAPHFADLKRQAAGLIAAIEKLTSDGGDLDRRRITELADAVKQFSDDLARAAHCEEVREAVTAPQKSRRMLRALHVVAMCGGLAGAAAVGADALVGGGIF